MPSKSSQVVHPFNGRHEDLTLGQLICVEHLQRTPSERRIKQLGDEWLPEKQGVFLVALLQDGEHEDEYHVVDGGTRMRFGQRVAGDDHVVPAWVMEMTEKEAARAFDIYNSESKRPTPFEHYRVGHFYGNPTWVAVKEALDTVGIEGGETSEYPQVIGAMRALYRIAQGAFRENKRIDSIDERWDLASERIVEVLELTREAYDSDDAHNADVLQAIARLRTQHGEFADGVRAHLEQTLASQTAGRWSQIAGEAKEAAGRAGSESRAIYMALALATEHNADAPAGSELRVKVARDVAAVVAA